MRRTAEDTHRFKRGYKNVINEAIRLNAEGEYTPLAIETSGHAALKENYFLDDGAYLVTRLLIALARESAEGREITDIIGDLPEPKEAAELRPAFEKGMDFKALAQDSSTTSPLMRKPFRSLSPRPIITRASA